MKGKQDLRIIKTKKNLFESLLSLLKEKPFEEIKVSDICEHALINRSTFYAHYNDKYELFADFIQNLKESFSKELLNNKEISNTKEYYLEMLRIFLDHIDQKREIYSFIMIHNKHSIIMDMIYDALNAEIRKNLEQNSKNEVPNDITAMFYLGAVFTVGTEWLNHKNRYSKQEILKYLDILISEKI